MFASLFALKKKANLQKRITTGRSETFSSLALRVRKKRNISGCIGSSVDHAGNEIATKSTSSLGLINEIMNSSSTAAYPKASWLQKNMTSESRNNQSTSDNYFKCISSPNEYGSLGTHAKWMVADCPNSFNNTSKQMKCVSESSLSSQNHKDNVPVVTRDGKTYKNRFCSRCHEVSDDELSYYILSFSCSIIPPRNYNKANTLTFLYSYCSVSWKPKSGHQRRYCYTSIIKKCSRETSEILRKGCQNDPPGYVSSLEKKGLGYKNVYTVLCVIPTHYLNVDQ